MLYMNYDKSIILSLHVFFYFSITCYSPVHFKEFFTHPITHKLHVAVTGISNLHVYTL